VLRVDYGRWGQTPADLRQLENDFLAGALGKAGLLSAKR
jgi:hypothetical protein